MIRTATIMLTSAALVAGVGACGEQPGDEGSAASTDESGGGTTEGTTGAPVPTEGSSETTQATGGTTADPEPTTGGGCEGPQIDFRVLELHLADLAGIAATIAGHPGPLEATSFFTAPGFSESSISFAGPLVEVCSQPMMYDAYCESGRCSQIFCTGLGAGWRVNTWLEPAPASQGDFMYDSVVVDVTWVDGEPGVSFILTATASRMGEDWSVMGQGTMDLTTMTVEETFPGLVPGASTVLTDTAVEGGHAGALTVDGVEIATLTPGGQLQPTMQCP